jgi:mannitol operon transcriptional antiterminator
VAEALASVLPGVAVPEDEIAYLVLHFGSSIERREKGRNRFRALVVCSAGIGSAQMLASRLRAEFPEIEVVANISWFDLKDLSRESYDFLISTVPLPLAAADYVLVNPLLDEEGVKAVRGVIVQREKRIREGQAPAGREGPGEEDSARGDLTRFLGAGMAMLEGLGAFREVDPGGTWEGLLSAVVRRCAIAGLIADPGKALEDLGERSRDGGILLPGGRILFLHARTPGVKGPSFSVHALSPAPGRDQAGRPLAAELLVLLLAPPRTSPETQAILNEMSVSLLDPRTAPVLAAADEAALRDYYARYLDRYIRSSPAQGA